MKTLLALGFVVLGLTQAHAASAANSTEACFCRWNQDTGLYEEYCCTVAPDGTCEFGQWTGDPCKADPQALSRILDGHKTVVSTD
jgi:hypothetical protein